MSNYTLIAPYRLGEIRSSLGFAREALLSGNKKAAFGYIEDALQVAEENGPAFDRMVKEYGLEKFVGEGA